MVKRYTCGCGTEMNFSSLRRHLKSQKHRAWEAIRDIDDEECGVCYEMTIDHNSEECDQCRHKLCQSCYQRLRQKKCPFCRKYYNDTPENFRPRIQVYFGNGLDDTPMVMDNDGNYTRDIDPDMLQFLDAVYNHIDVW